MEQQAMLLVLLCVCFLGSTNGIKIGGWSPIDVSLFNPIIQTALNAIKASQYGNDAPDMAVLTVVSAQSQIVAGQNFKLDLQMTNGLGCKLTIWSRPWLNGTESAQVTQGPECSVFTGGVSLPKYVNSNDAEVMDALHFANCDINSRVNSAYAYILSDLSGATYTEQVTAGMWYRFKDVPLHLSTCLNKGCAALTSYICRGQQNANLTMTCSFSIIDQAWMTPRYTMSSFNCN